MWPTSVVSVFELFSLVNVGNLLAGWLKPSLKTLYPFHAKEFVYWCHQLFCKNDLGKRLNSLECSFWELRSVWVGSIPQEQHPLEQHPPNDFHWSNFATSSLHVVKAFWVKLTNVWGMHRSLSDCMVMICVFVDVRVCLACSQCLYHTRWACGKVTPVAVAPADVTPLDVTSTYAAPMAVASV